MALAALSAGCPPPAPLGNTPPVASNKDFDATVDTTATITLSAADPDTGDVLTFILLSLPTYGTLTDPNADLITTTPYTLTVNGAQVLYTPDASYTGDDSFTYAAFDGQAQSNAATVSITVADLEPEVTYLADTTLPSLTVPAGTTSKIVNNAVLTITGDAAIDGVLFAESGRITLKVAGDLTINGTIRVNDPDADAADESALNDQPTGIFIVIGGGALTFGAGAVLNSNGPIVVTDDETQLTRTPMDFFDEVEDVASDALPTFVPLPPDNPAFNESGPPKVSIAPILQGGVLGPVTVTGTWPPAGAAPPPGDRPILILRFNGNRVLNIDNWMVNGPPAPPRDPADQSANPGSDAKGAKGKDGLRLSIHNNGGPINIVNNVVLNLTDGGDAGDATAVCATATGESGGNSGNFRMTAAAGIDITRGTLTINPGRGGRGGAAFVDPGEPGAAGCPGATGRSGTAIGGKGGDNTKRLFVRGNVVGLENVIIGLLSGGDGGLADVETCDGGPGLPCCDGGPGGAATATGGAGGNASLSVSGLPVTTGLVSGGDGGDATAEGGYGGDGGDCKLEDGGNGGAGGAGSATGGAGGTASNDGAGGAMGGNGGDATAEGGDGDDGGDSGLGAPGNGGAGGTADANPGAGGAATTAGSAGNPTETEGENGADGGEIIVVLYCFDFGFLGDGAGSVEPGTYAAPVFDSSGAMQLGTVNVTLVDEPGAIYARSGDPVQHVGIGGGTLVIDVSSLQLETPSGVISGLQIAPLYGTNISLERPLEVEALNGDGSTIDSRSFDQVPDNSATTDNPHPLNAEFDVDESVATFQIVVPPETFVTIIRVYLVDP